MAVKEFLYDTFIRRPAENQSTGVPIEELRIERGGGQAPAGPPLLEQQLVLSINRLVGIVFLGSFFYLVGVSLIGRPAASLIENAFSGSLGFFLSTLASHVESSRMHPAKRPAKTKKAERQN